MIDTFSTNTGWEAKSSLYTQRNNENAVKSKEGRIAHEWAATLHICTPCCQDPDSDHKHITGAGAVTAQQGPGEAVSSRMKRYENLTYIILNFLCSLAGRVLDSWHQFHR